MIICNFFCFAVTEDNSFLTLDPRGILQTEFVTIFEETQFTIYINAYPTPKVSWMKDDQALTEDFYISTKMSRIEGNRWVQSLFFFNKMCMSKKLQSWNTKNDQYSLKYFHNFFQNNHKLLHISLGLYTRNQVDHNWGVGWMGQGHSIQIYLVKKNEIKIRCSFSYKKVLYW